MRKLSRVMCVLVAVLAVSHPAVAGDHPEPRLITVTGDAEVKVAPDEVILTLGVRTWDIDLGKAKADNDQRMQNIIKLAKEFKIEDKHVQTDYVRIEPRYQDQWEHREFVGYFVSKKVDLTLKDISKFEDLLSGVLEAGADYVHGIDFRATEDRKYRDEARVLAIKAAKEKADALARELGQKVGKPHMIVEDQIRWWNGSEYSNAIQNYGGAQAQSTVAFGQITVDARVTVSFELELAKLK